MAKVPVTLVLRSDQKVEVDTDVYDYKYQCVGPLLFSQSNRRFTFNDAQTINQTTKVTQSLKGVFPNDKTDRVGRITNIIVHNKLYEVDSVVPFGPDITVTPGELSKMTLEEVGYGG